MTVSIENARKIFLDARDGINSQLAAMLDQISPENNDIRDFANQMLIYIDPVIWVLPAATSHHMVDERGLFGVLIHTERVINAVKVLCTIFNITGREKDWLLCGAILHDPTKRGVDCNMDYTDNRHPITVREIYNSNPVFAPSDVETFFYYVERHMGRWGHDEEKSPEVPEVDPRINDTKDKYIVLHMADVVSSKLSNLLSTNSINLLDTYKDSIIIQD